MSWESWVVVIVAVATGLSPFALIIHLRNLAHSRFRDRLWTIRDELVDGLLSGQIEPSPAASRLLHVIETSIRIVGRHSFIDALIAAIIVRGREIEPLADGVLSDDLRPSDRAKLADLLAAFSKAVTDHLLSGSLSGWLASAAWAVYRVGYRVFRGRLKEERTRHTEIRKQLTDVEAQVMPELQPARRRTQNTGPVLARPGA